MAQETVVAGVVLRRGYLGEYDKWVSLLSPDLGKLRLRVRGGRKPQSKMGMLTEPLCHIKARVIEGRTQKLLVQPQLVRSFINIRHDLERLTIALALGETLDWWLPDEHAEPEVYAVFIDALEALEGGELPAAVAAQAVWRWLAVLGYEPDLSRCARCGAMGTGESRECVIVGGQLLCARCTTGDSKIRLSSEALRGLQQCLQGEPLIARPEQAQTLLRAGLHYAEEVLESPLRWLEFWERLNALRESG